MDTNFESRWIKTVKSYDENASQHMNKLNFRIT